MVIIIKLLRWYGKFYMRYLPGTLIKVKWPTGWVAMNKSHDGTILSRESADPNDHYRPWMEKNVGRQGIDWQWDLLDNDIMNNTISIKFRKGKEKYASIAAIMWS